MGLRSNWDAGELWSVEEGSDLGVGGSLHSMRALRTGESECRVEPARRSQWSQQLRKQGQSKASGVLLLGLQAMLVTP